MTRNQLKQIIKECLIEILADGMGSDLTETIQLAKTQPKKQVLAQGQTRRPGLDSVSYGQKPASPKNLYQEQVKQTVNQITRDPIMASIFADTMQTTMVDQNAADRQPSQMMAAAYGNNSGPPDDFVEPRQRDVPQNETYARWSEAAFAPSTGGGMGGMAMASFAQEMEQMNREMKKA